MHCALCLKEFRIILLSRLWSLIIRTWEERSISSEESESVIAEISQITKRKIAWKRGKEEMILITQIIRINIGFFIAEGTKFDQKGRKIDWIREMNIISLGFESRKFRIFFKNIILNKDNFDSGLTQSLNSRSLFFIINNGAMFEFSPTPKFVSLSIRSTLDFIGCDSAGSTASAFKSDASTFAAAV